MLLICNFEQVYVGCFGSLGERPLMLWRTGCKYAELWYDSDSGRWVIWVEYDTNLVHWTKSQIIRGMRVWGVGL